MGSPVTLATWTITVGVLPHPSVPSDTEHQKRAATAAPPKGSKTKKQRASTRSAKKAKSSSGSLTETSTPPKFDFDLAPKTLVNIHLANDEQDLS
ncbi:hypothetical protein PF010_g5232 [Phytophthora fragariae]|uniref:Uncharacterized protein n=1 Tax=Phytophthora fragariae TaxID=53985 RepID=A0A6G0LPT0_9STRA|nr:hypothetical protein PF010_g5232 [Phytophthora fragariae]KAE9241270.1 hypothetical protein PF004_g7124 [Phytophthora fragariae]